MILAIKFREYPLDKFALVSMMFNPIDLSRTLILIKLDISALLGYTGAVFKQFFGASKGLLVSLFILCLWVVFPLFRMRQKLLKKDF